MDRVFPVDGSFECDRLDIVYLLMDILNRPDDAEISTGLGLGAAGQPGAESPKPVDPETELNDPATTEARKWAILAERFPGLFDDPQTEQPANLPPLPPKNLADVQRMQAEAEQGQGQAVTSFEADLSKLRDLPREELTDDQGNVVVSKVAAALGKSAGGGRWGYYKGLASAIQLEYDAADADQAAA